jgi:hypothetical protein
MVIVPDHPIQLQNDVSVTNKKRIGFVWSDGFSDGGSPILDYRVSYD